MAFNKVVLPEDTSPSTKMRFFSNVVDGFCVVMAASKEIASLSFETDFGAATWAFLEDNQAILKSTGARGRALTTSDKRSVRSGFTCEAMNARSLFETFLECTAVSGNVPSRTLLR